MRSLTGSNSVFSISLIGSETKVNDATLTYYLPIAREKIRRILFPRLCEMQTTLSKIWTRVAVSVYYHGNRYTTSALTHALTHSKTRVYVCAYVHLCVGVCKQ